jgi:hypothetical protein
MKSVPNLRSVVEDVELHHVAFEPPFRYLKRRVDDAHDRRPRNGLDHP